MKNYYRILGLNIDAEHEEIKAAYRILAQRYHPDKGGAAAEFQLIQEAYEILSNPLTKRTYDQDLLKNLSGQSVHQIRPITNKKSYLQLWLIISIVFAIASIGFAGWAFYKTKSSEAQQILTTLPQPISTPTKQNVKHKSNTNKHPQSIKPAPTLEVNMLNGMSGTYYVINLGSFDNLSAAQTKQQQLKQQGIISKIQQISANEVSTGSYNLFIGPYRNQNIANNIEESMINQNIDAVVERIDNN